MPKWTFLSRNLNITVKKIVTGPFQENSFIVSLDNRNEAILIDPGDDCQLIIDQVDKKNLKPKKKYKKKKSLFDRLKAMLGVFGWSVITP